MTYIPSKAAIEAFPRNNGLEEVLTTNEVRAIFDRGRESLQAELDARKVADRVALADLLSHVEAIAPVEGGGYIEVSAYSLAGAILASDIIEDKRVVQADAWDGGYGAAMSFYTGIISKPLWNPYRKGGQK